MIDTTNYVVMGIDQSLSSTGIYCLKNFKPYKCEVIRTSAEPKKTPKQAYVSENVYKRIAYIATHIRVSILDFEVDHVAIEGLGFAAKGNQTRTLAGLQHVIINELVSLNMTHGLTWEIVPPNTLKKFATGHGKASKDDMLSFMMDYDPTEWAYLKDIPKSHGREDLVDAFWLAHYGCLQKKEEKNKMVAEAFARGELIWD